MVVVAVQSPGNGVEEGSSDVSFLRHSHDGLGGQLVTLLGGTSRYCELP